MITAADLLTDAQVAKLAHLSLCAFQRKMKSGDFASGELDWRQARPVQIGRSRMWFRPDVEAVITERKVAR